MGNIRGYYVNTPNAFAAADRLVSAGYTREQAAGIVGNLIAESGVEPHSVQPGGPGRGIAQWSKGERWQELQNWAAANRQNPTLLDTQVSFLVYELQHGESKAGKALKNATTVQAASSAFMILDERPHDQSQGAQNARGNIGWDFYQLWQKVEPVPHAPGAIENIGNAVTGGASAVASGAASAAKGTWSAATFFGDHINDPSFWLRVGLVVIGLGLLFIAADKVVSGGLTGGSGNAPKVRAVPVPV